MKRLQLAVVLFAATVCSSLNAQTTSLRANIPFDFRVGTTLMPAGEYQFDCHSGVLVARELNGRHTVMALTNPEIRAQAPKTGVLEFNRYGNAYFFKGMWSPNSDTGRELLKSSREKELARRVGNVETTALALQGK
jgi:hypothetical protein